MAVSRRVFVLGCLAAPLAGCIGGGSSAPPAFDLSAARRA